MDNNENYYFCYDFYFDDDGDDERDFHQDFPGGRCWGQVAEPVVQQDPIRQVTSDGLPSITDRKGTKYYNLSQLCQYKSQDG